MLVNWCECRECRDLRALVPISKGIAYPETAAASAEWYANPAKYQRKMVAKCAALEQQWITKTAHNRVRDAVRADLASPYPLVQNAVRMALRSAQA